MISSYFYLPCFTAMPTSNCLVRPCAGPLLRHQQGEEICHRAAPLPQDPAAFKLTQQLLVHCHLRLPLSAVLPALSSPSLPLLVHQPSEVTCKPKKVMLLKSVFINVMNYFLSMFNVQFFVCLFSLLVGRLLLNYICY